MHICTSRPTKVATASGMHWYKATLFDVEQWYGGDA